MKRVICVFVAGGVLFAWAGLAAAGPKEGDGGTVVLSAGAVWRKHSTFFPPRVSVAAAKAAEKDTDAASRTKALRGKCLSGLKSDPPPAGWTSVAFDDSTWPRGLGGDFTTGDSRMPPGADLVYARGTDRGVAEVGLQCLRGRFTVTDPGKVGKLTLLLTCRGGFVAYLNGTEIARGSLPGGKIAFDTPAEDYPLEAFVVKEGRRAKPLHWWNHRDKKFLPHWSKRERQFGPKQIDTKLLRKGVNVLAVELHRSDYPVECGKKKVGLCFATVGLSKLFLAADAPAGVVAGPVRRPEGLGVWTIPAWSAAMETSFADPAEKPQAVRIPAARNGQFSGQLVVGSTRAIEGLVVSASELKGAGGAIPAAAVKVWYGSINPTQPGTSRYGWRQTGVYARRFDVLNDKPPATVEPVVFDKPSAAIRGAMGLPARPAPAAVLPVLVSVSVPKGAKAGRYSGTVTVSAKGAEAVKLPVELTVADWTLPDVKDYVGLLNIYQSPDSIVRYYKLQPWSQKHWAMIERSLKLMGEVGNIGLHFPLLAESQFGNPESMVIWKKKPPRPGSGQADGAYDYDFTVFDRYLATALKYHNRLRFLAVCAYGGGPKVTVLDPATGKKENMPLPAFGSAECEKLLKPLLTAVRDRLAAKGLDKLMLLGLPSDRAPKPEAVAMFARILPGVAWARESHFNANSFRADPKDPAKTVAVKYTSVVWGGAIPDPASRWLYGWRYNPDHLMMNFNRAGCALNLHGFASPWSFRVWMAYAHAGGRNGNGRVGADYWRLGVNVRSTGRISSEAHGGSGGTLFGSYIHSAVGQVGLGNSTTDLLAPGPEGPVTTLRFENAREGNQEAEARVVIERALLDKDAPLPAALAKRCQALLDERANGMRMPRLGLQTRLESTRKLYELAGEVERAKKEQ